MLLRHLAVVQAAEALEAWQDWAPHARDQLTSIFHLSAGGGNDGERERPVLRSERATLSRLLAPLRAVGGASVSSRTIELPLTLQLLWAGCSHISLRRLPHRGHAAAGGTLQRDELPGEVRLREPNRCPRAAAPDTRAAAEARAELLRARRDPVRLLRRRDQPRHSRPRRRSCTATSCSASSTSPTTAAARG